MEVTPAKLLAACVAIFGGVVAINFLAQYRSNEQFRDRLSNIDFSSLRARVIKEEGLPTFDVLEPPEEITDSEPLLKED